MLFFKFCGYIIKEKGNFAVVHFKITISMEIIITYKTRDGRIYKSKKEAEAREKEIENKELCELCQGDGKDPYYHPNVGASGPNVCPYCSGKGYK